MTRSESSTPRQSTWRRSPVASSSSIQGLVICSPKPGHPDYDEEVASVLRAPWASCHPRVHEPSSRSCKAVRSREDRVPRRNDARRAHARAARETRRDGLSRWPQATAPRTPNMAGQRSPTAIATCPNNPRRRAISGPYSASRSSMTNDRNRRYERLPTLRNRGSTERRPGNL